MLRKTFVNQTLKDNEKKTSNNDKSSQMMNNLRSVDKIENEYAAKTESIQVLKSLLSSRYH